MKRPGMAAPAATTTTNGDNGTDKLVNCKYINKMEERGARGVGGGGGAGQWRKQDEFGIMDVQFDWRNWGYTQGDGDKDR